MALLAVAVSAASTQAKITVQADSVSVVSASLPTSVGLEIYLQTDTPSLSISAFQVRASIDDFGSNIAILSAGRPQSHAYLGPSQQPVVSIVGNRVDAGDINFVGSTPLLSGAGLLRFELSVPAATPPGFYPLTIVPDEQYTFLADANATSLPLTIASGGLRIIDQLISGDYNQDSYVDRADYQQWRATFGQPAAPSGSGADGNHNGAIDAADYTIWRDHLLPRPGDYDADGLVIAADYQLWKLNFGSTANLAADGNRNGVVDAADYTVWRDNLTGPSTALLNRDPNNSGPVSAGDYDFWKSHFGQTAPSVSAGTTSNAGGEAPEPASLALFVLGIALVACHRASPDRT